MIRPAFNGFGGVNRISKELCMTRMSSAASAVDKMGMRYLHRAPSRCLAVPLTALAEPMGGRRYLHSWIGVR